MKIPRNFIIGKKQLILASLTLVLGAAVYMNYALSDSSEDISVGIPDEEAAVASVLGDKNEADVLASENYGDTVFVNGDTGESDYFAQARLTRMTTRDEAVETLSAILGGGDLSTEETATYTNEAITISKLAESEGEIENLIKAQGFSECVVYLDDASANIVVQSSGLEAQQVAQIKDILLTEVTIPTSNIRIFEVK